MTGPTAFAQRPSNPFSMPSPSTTAAFSSSSHATLNGRADEGKRSNDEDVGKSADGKATTSPYDATLALQNATKIQELLAEPVRFVRKNDSTKPNGSAQTEAERLGYVPCNRPGFILAPSAAQPASSSAPELPSSPSKYPQTPTSSLPAAPKGDAPDMASSTGGSTSRTLPLVSRGGSPTPSSATEPATPSTPRKTVQSGGGNQASTTPSGAPTGSRPSAQAPGPKDAAPATASSQAQPAMVRDLFQFPIPMAFARDTVKPNVDPVGLRNNGNTCYQNSVMQALVHTAPLSNLFVTRNGNELRGRGGKRDADFCTVDATRAFMRRVLVDQKLTAPFELNRSLKQFARPLRIGRQEDAHEFLRFLLEGMQRACLLINPRKLNSSNPLTSTNFVHKIFGGRLRSRVHCLSCGHDSDTFDPFLDLSLDIRAGNSGGFGSLGSLANCLAAFTRVEKLDGKNKYKCEKCTRLTPAHKHFTLDEVPPILTVQLKRFTLTGQKNQSAIQFPEYLKLGPFMSAAPQGPETAKKGASQGRPSNGDPVYRLYAVVHHFGGGPNSGHYVATVRRGSTWYRCDDSSTYPVQINYNDSSAYILFYQREGLSMIETKLGLLRKASVGGGTTAAAAHGGAPSSAGSVTNAPAKRRASSSDPVADAPNGSLVKTRKLSDVATQAGSGQAATKTGPSPSEFRPRFVSTSTSTSADSRPGSSAGGMRSSALNGKVNGGAEAGPSNVKSKPAIMSLLERAMAPKLAQSPAATPAPPLNADGDDVGERVEEAGVSRPLPSVVEQQAGMSETERKRKRTLISSTSDDGDDGDGERDEDGQDAQDAQEQGQEGGGGNRTGADGLKDALLRFKKRKKMGKKGSAVLGVFPRLASSPGGASDAGTSSPAVGASASGLPAGGGGGSSGQQLSKRQRKRLRQAQRSQLGGGASTASPFSAASGVGMGGGGGGGALRGGLLVNKQYGQGRAAKMGPRAGPGP